MTASVPSEFAADLCRVVGAGEDVVIHFGQAVAAEELAGAWKAVPLQRIVMSEGGAAKLQDLLVDLLRQPDSVPPRKA